MKLYFLRKHPTSLMCEATWWKYYTDGRGGLALGMFETRFTETQVRCEEKITTRVVHPGAFDVLQ